MTVRSGHKTDSNGGDVGELPNRFAVFQFRKQLNGRSIDAATVGCGHGGGVRSSRQAMEHATEVASVLNRFNGQATPLPEPGGSNDDHRFPRPVEETIAKVDQTYGTEADSERIADSRSVVRLQQRFGNQHGQPSAISKKAHGVNEEIRPRARGLGDRYTGTGSRSHRRVSSRSLEPMVPNEGRIANHRPERRSAQVTRHQFEEISDDAVLGEQAIASAHVVHAGRIHVNAKHEAIRILNALFCKH